MAEEHSQMYKNVGKAEQETSRRRRTETTIQLRREKRGNELNKRRNIDETAEYESEVSDYEKDKVQFQYTLAEARKVLTENPSIEDLRNVFTFLRKQLSRPKHAPIDEIVREGLVQALVQGLAVDDIKVKYEAAWALTNVVSGDSQHTQNAVNCGATQGLIKAAYADDDSLAEQCFWGVANIIGDCPELRDHAIQCGFLDVLTHYVTPTKVAAMKVSFVRTLSWVCTNLCRHKQAQLSLEHVAVVLPIIKMFLDYKDTATKTDVTWALSYITDTSDEILDMTIKAGILPKVRELLHSSSPEMLAPAVRVFGNFTSGADAHTECVIKLGIINREIPAIMEQDSPKLIKEVIWMLSNVLAGTVPQIQAVIDAGLIPKILQSLRCGDFRTQSEGSWALSNLCASGNREQVYYLATCDVFQYIVPLLNVRQVEFISHILSVIKSVFNTISAIHHELLDDYKQSFEEIGGIDVIEELQNHENAGIYEACYEIIQSYFLDEDDAENSPYPGQKGAEDVAEMNKPVFNF